MHELYIFMLDIESIRLKSTLRSLVDAVNYKYSGMSQDNRDRLLQSARDFITHISHHDN